MRAILSKAGIRVGSRLEPATAERLVQLMRRAGYHQPDIEQAVGCRPERFLELNSKPLPLPLWAAAALVLEAIGVLPDETPA